MELPHIGQHCEVKSCHKLDFLPIKCDACNNFYCSSHYVYEKHTCPKRYENIGKVPICPLCGSPVPVAPGLDPNLYVSRHIDENCKSHKSKVYHNTCSYKKCKQKEVIRVECKECKQNFCLRHRHTLDHQCNGTNSNNKNIPNKPQENSVATKRPFSRLEMTAVQGHISEDEALARALANSLNDCQEDNVQQTQNQSNKNCSLS